MRLDDLLRVMREEFAQAADSVDDRTMGWLTEGSDAPDAGMAHAEAIAAELGRLASTARVIALNGLASALEHVRDSACALALLDAETLGVGLSWLAVWREPFEKCFEAPGAAPPADELLQWLAGGPMVPDAEALAALRTELVSPPVLPGELEGDGSLAQLPPATAEDVSLAVPDDVDRDLFDVFLADAPRQMENLSERVRALVRGQLGADALLEAQRVAHTFKGSGSIIGVRGIGRLAHRIEDLIEFAATQPGRRLPAPMGRDLEQATDALEQMLYALRGEEEPPHDALGHLQRLLDWVNAIQDGSWVEKAQAGGDDGLPTLTEALEATPEAGAPAKVSAATVAASATAEAEPELRVGVSRLERLVRRAGQALVQGGRLTEHVRSLEERLHTLQAHSLGLQQRVAELQAALDRQGVALRGKPVPEGAGSSGAPGGAGAAVATVGAIGAIGASGVVGAVGAEGAVGASADFDPLEMDRYNQLHTLARFVAELADDEIELHRGAREEAARAQVALREHAQALKEQHRELLAARLLPFRHVASRLKRTVSQTAAMLGRQAELVIEGDTVQLDSDVLDRLTEPLLHLLRNAVDHGIEPPEERVLNGKAERGTVHLRCARDGQTVRIEIQDDGRGIDLDAVHRRALGLGLLPPGEVPTPDSLARLILLPGFTTRDQVTEVSGRGVGMDVVAERVRSMKGRLDIATRPLAGTTFTVRVPATTGSLHALLVQAGGELFALPTDTVARAVPAGQGDWSTDSFQFEGVRYRHARLTDWLALPDSGLPAGDRPVVLVRVGPSSADGHGLVALIVDQVVDARELVLQDLGTLLRRVRGVVGGAVRPDGRALFVLDPEQLERGSAQALSQLAIAALQRRSQVQRKRVLVVDDAISVRKAVAQMLGDAGFETLLARDGFDALQQLARTRVDLVVTDLEMPNLNGLDLVRHMRRDDAQRGVPVVMITSRATEKHREAALDAGVNRYLTKPYTDADLLVDVRRLLPA